MCARMNFSKDTKPYNDIKAKDFPPMVLAELTNVCNSACTYCPHAEKVKRPRYKEQYMPFNIFKKIVDEVRANPESVLRITCDGEPLLHPEFCELISYADKYSNNCISINSNGSFITDKQAETLLKLKNGIVEFSINAFNENTFNRTRVGLDYKKVIENIRAFIDRKKMSSSKTKVMVSIIQNKDTIDEIGGFVEYWTPLADKVLIRRAMLFENYLKNRKNKKYVREKRIPCPVLWTKMTIAPNGGVKLCVNDWFDEEIIDSLTSDKTISRIWSGKEYKKNREFHLSGKFNKIPVCFKCVDWKIQSWEDNYFRVIDGLKQGEIHGK